MSGYTKKIRNGEIGQKTSAFDLSKHTNFGHIDDYSMSMPIDPAKAAGYSPEVVALAAKLKYQHEKDFEPSGCKTSKFNDEFYLQYAKRQLDLTFDSSFDKVLGGIDVAPDPAYAQYSYEEIIAMANNGVNIPKSVLAWAKAQQEADVVDYVVISDNVDYNDENSKDKENGESEINKIRLEVKDNALKAKKAQEDISKNREKTAELTNQASDIAKEQKNIFRNNSIDKTEQMVNEWKELDKKKNESGLDSAENAKYKQLSEKLDKSGEIIQSMKKSSAHLDNFLESIDSLNEEANEGITTAQKTINSASALTNLDDRLNTFVKVHAYKIADKSSGMLEDTLSNLDDVQLAYVSEKIGHDLEDLGNETFEDIHNDDTQEIIKFADAYVNKANHIEHDLGVDEENDDNKKSEKSEQKEQFAGSNTLAKGMNEMFEDNKNSLSDNPFGFMFSFMSNPEVAATFTAATILSTEFALTESAVLNGESVALGLLAEKEKKEDKKLEEVADESVDKFKSNNAKIGENEEKIEQIEENAKVQDSASGSIEISEATNDSLKQIKQLKQTQVTDNTEAESQELSLKEENELLSSENESLTNKVEKPLDDSAQALSKSKKYLKSVDANNQILKADTNELNEISNNTAKIATESLKASLTNVAISAGLYVAGTSMLPSPTGLFLIKTAAAWDITASLQLTGSAFATAGAVSGVVGAGVSELQNDATNSVVKAVTGSNKESKTLITETANEMGGLAAPEDIKENDNQQDNPVEDNVNSGQNEDENNNSSNVGFSNEAQEQDKNLVVQVPIGSPDEDKFTEPLFAPIVSQESKINFTASPLKDEQAEVAFAPARTRAAMTKNPYVNEEDEAESILENEEEQKIAQAPEVEEPEETEEIQEVAQVPEVEEPEETEEIQDVAQVPEVEEPGETEETQDVAQAPEVEEPEETEETQDVAQVPEVEETEETEDVAQVPEVEEPEETEEIQEVAQAPEVEQTEETEETEDVAQVPEVEQTEETEEIQDVAQAPEVEETQIINEGTFTGAASELQLAEAATISGKMKTRGYAGKSDNNENPNVIDSDVDESEPTVIPTIEAENTPSENTQDFSNGSEQIQEEPAPVENEPVSLNETPQEPVLDSSSGEGVINSTDDIRDYVRGAVSMGKQPQEIISSLSNATRSTNVEAPIQTTPKNDSGKTEQVNKTSEKQNEQKQEKISDPQAELKSAYGSNEDFVKLVIANSIVELIALGPVAFTFNLIKVASIVGLSVLDLFSKKDIVNQSSQLADADVQTANTATSQLVSKSNEIKAKHDKNVVLAKSYAAQYKVLNDDSINAQFEMMQNQALLLQEGKITQDQVQSDFADINAGEKDAIRTNVAKISEKDSNMLNSINEPSSKLEKTLKQTNKLVTGFDGLNEKLSERNENNNQMGDVVIAESITSQIIITGIIAALLACGPWCWGLVALWAAVLGQNVAFAATGVAAKIASNKVDGNIDSNIQKVKDAHKTMANIDKQAADVRKVMKKASLDKMNYLPPQEEQETLGQMPMPEQNDNNRNDTEFGDNDDARNSVISFVRKDSDTRSGFDKSSWNAEIDINNPNDVKKANEYAIAYTRDVNDADEKSKAAASTNASAQGDTTTKADVKLARFNRDGAKDSSKRSKKVNATSASHNGRKRR